MANPTCLVNDLSTLNGVDVLDGYEVEITLQDRAGVAQWSIECIYTDENSDKDVINGLLTVNLASMTATFTPPTVGDAGAAYIFQSKVNAGLDVNGRIDSSLTTTFGIFIRAGTGLRVHAFNETTESNAQFGWLPDFNNLNRNFQTVTGLIPANAGAGLILSGGNINVQTADASIVVNADSIQVGVISDSNHGTRSGGTLHDAVTGATNGFMIAADKTKLDTSTSSPTASSIAQRDSNGDIQFRNISLTGTQIACTTSTGFTLQTSDQIAVTSKPLTFATGTTNTGGGGANTGSVSIYSGQVISAGTSGNVLISTGDSGSGAAGSIYLNPGIGTSGSNIGLFGGASTNFQSGRKIAFIGDRATEPTGNPINGIFLYSESGTLRLRTSTGPTITFAGSTQIVTGSSTDGISNNAFQFLTETRNTAGENSRPLVLSSGTCNTGRSGKVTISSGPSTADGYSGDVEISTGLTFSGTSGKIILNTGAGSTRGNITMFNNTGSFGGGQGVVYIANAQTTPTSNPIGGVILYSSGGQLWARTTTGNYQLTP